MAGLLRTRLSVRQAIRCPSTSHSRAFHLAGYDAVKFLAEQAPSLDVASAEQSASKGKGAISVLLHADRRSYTFSNGHVHFGPTIVACSSKLLTKTRSQDEYGQGDVGIMNVREAQPESTIVQPIKVEQGLSYDDALAFAKQLTSDGEKRASSIASTLCALWSVFDACEGVYFTFSIDDAATAVVHSPYLDFDDFAVHRVDALHAWHARRAREPNAARAEDGGLFYIKLPNKDGHDVGNVGSFGYGAGNAMATMDGLALVGGRPANFLDGGGGANKANAKLAIETLHGDKDVRSIFVNTFGGITQTDVVAEGIIEAVRENDIRTPITVRVLGTGAERAKELLAQSGLGFVIEDDFKTAAKAAVQRASS